MIPLTRHDQPWLNDDMPATESLAARTTLVGTTIHDEDVTIVRNVAGSRYHVLIGGVRYSSGLHAERIDAIAYAASMVPAHRRAR